MFFIKYLRTLGFDVMNDIFAQNAWYFRNALVRANYNDLVNDVHKTTEYLELFLKNLLLGEKNELHNRTMHIKGDFKQMNESEILIRKGFAMDDERIKGNGGGMYWKELLDRIRDIRSSEKIINNTGGRNGYIEKRLEALQRKTARLAGKIYGEAC